MLRSGDPAPDFVLTADDGRAVRLSDYRGRRLIIFFYPKAGTSGCTTQACGFRDRFEVIEAKGATVLGISPDAPAKLARWRAAESLPYALLSDPDHAVAEAYGVWGEKSLYGKTYMGVIRSHFVIGPDGRVEDARVKISPKDSVEEAVGAI